MPKRLSASNASKFIACHASANLEVAIPGFIEPDRVYGGAAQAGTDVHKVIEDLLGIEYVTKSRTSKFSAKDMMAVGKMLTYIGEVWSRRRFTVLSEEKVVATWLTTQPSTTADIVMFTQDEIHIMDPKWGTIPVEVVGNKQLLFYAACYGQLAPKAKGVTVHILQPRADNLASWFIDAATLKQFMDEAVAAELAIESGDVTMSPGDHCTFCPANPHSRGGKGTPSCPVMMDLLGYVPAIPVDEDEILSL